MKETRVKKVTLQGVISFTDTAGRTWTYMTGNIFGYRRERLNPDTELVMLQLPGATYNTFAVEINQAELRFSELHKYWQTWANK